jgi:ribonuclease H2 subunit A
MGFNDSKQLKEGERDKLFQRIRDHPSIGWAIEELNAEQISQEMLRAHPISLNSISYDAVIKILQQITIDPEVAEGVNDIFIDTVGEPETYKSRLLSGLFDSQCFKNANFVIESKADAKYKVVSAASIIAKVTRKFKKIYFQFFFSVSVFVSS